MNYEYGKEYPCSGHKPGIEGDVVVEVKTKRFNFGELSAAKVSSIKWGSVLGFRIVDERYKQKSEDSSWFERGWLPPVGWHGECRWGRDGNFFECVILPYSKLARAGYGGDWVILPIGKHIEIEFRPLKTEREKAIEAAFSCLKNAGFDSDSTNVDYFNALYDAGLLRLPEGK